MTKTKEKIRWLIGIDEVGRGPLAGPVMVCAAAIKIESLKEIENPILTDSKKMTQKNRNSWFKKSQDLKNKNVIRFIITKSQANSIDKNGINIVIKGCIQTALKRLEIKPEEAIVLLDGGLVAPKIFTQKTIIKGDMSEKIISLASVIAKVSRDEYMIRKSQEFPGYFWLENKGYGTKKHILAIKKYGLTPLHRKSFVKNIIDKNQ